MIATMIAARLGGLVPSVYGGGRTTARRSARRAKSSAHYPGKKERAWQGASRLSVAGREVLELVASTGSVFGGD